MANNEDHVLGEIELDAIGEVMNISMGSAATAMSTVLDRKVSITTPEISNVSVEDFNFDFLHPVVGVEIKYVEGIEGVNVLILRKADVAKIVGHLLSMDPAEIDENDEIGQSAICEIMNQMMGSSASALATFLGKSINISPPGILANVEKESVRELFEITSDTIISIKFQLNIEGLVESEFLSALEPKLAKEIVEVSLQFNGIDNENKSEKIGDDEMAALNAQEPAAQTGNGHADFQPGVQSGAQTYTDPAYVQGDSMPGSIPGPMPGYVPGPMPGPMPESMPGSMDQGDMAQWAYMNPNPNLNPGNGQHNQTQAPPNYANAVPPGYMPYPPPGYAMPPVYPPNRVATSAYTFKTLGNADGAGDQDNLELVMTVPIQISVELGRTKKRIKDIADLGVGNIVELDRQAGDHVDVIANGKLIARGDVVVVDDNYSVRITEIIKQPEEFI